MSLTSSILLAAAAAMLSDAAPPAGAPIRLVITEEGHSIRLQVVADTDEPVTARYSLEVESEGRAGRNRSAQSGNAREVVGHGVVLSSSRISRPEGGSWSALLRVEPVGGQPYEEVRISQSDLR